MVVPRRHVPDPDALPRLYGQAVEENDVHALGQPEVEADLAIAVGLEDDEEVEIDRGDMRQTYGPRFRQFI